MSFVYNIVKGLSKLTVTYKQPYPDIHMLDFKIVNAFIIGNVRMRKYDWVIVDTGISNSGKTIVRTGEKLFGILGAPQAIVLTHGHFDHIGGVEKILDRWNVPVYAHSEEIPYLVGEKSYPEPQPEVEGLVSKMSPFFPQHYLKNIIPLPPDGYVPCMPEWRWIYTPGHSCGHIALYRESDGVLLAGDAFTTLKQESLLSLITKKEQIGGPPADLTPDWENSRRSIETLRNLNPKFALPSHGKPLQGASLLKHLDLLIINFQEKAVTEQYGDQPNL
ncbi:MAG: MBL fold metallo-hydrolase [Bacilli bacterium]|nr:MBL fold metallo-hydrolase [Bacilli bacterium]MDD4076768.1 MBL fold metallo-hydrolase [Bacilli bacterium]MDD4389044.1 MBL fold metallo-hydrolase [Bacilli bacterium]